MQNINNSQQLILQKVQNTPLVVNNSKEFYFKKGEDALSSGDTLRYFYFIMSGKIKIYDIDFETSKEQTLYMLSHGDMFDVVSLLDGKPNQYISEVLEDTHVIRVPLVDGEKMIVNRMFTSRAEYRLLLREESADIRLSKYGHKLGLISDEEYARVERKSKQIDYGAELLESMKFTPNKEFNALLSEMDEQPLKDVSTAQQLVARKSFDVEKMLKIVPELAKFDDYIKEEILVEGKYARYIDKQSEEIERMKKYLKIKIPEGFDFRGVSGLSKEVQEKLKSFAPPTLQAAMNISGITPAAIEILHIYIKMAARSKRV